jgi:nitroreductase
MPLILDVLSQRWSPRAFAPQTVEKEKVIELFEAARWAPSCYNDQPWSFLLTRRGQDPSYEQLLACLMPANQAWAATAPLLVLNAVRQNFLHNGKPNRWAFYDLGLAVGNLLAQATALGLSVHQMAGFDPVLAHSSLELPADHEAVAVMAIGYLGDAALLPAGVEEKSPLQRDRKSQEDMLHMGRWKPTHKN